MNTQKKTALGILGATAATAFVLGATAPAMADDTTQSWSADTTETKTRILESLGISNESPVVVAPEVSTGDVSTGDVHTGDILSGILSGNEVGNGNVVGSGNDTAIGSGNETGLNVSDLVDGHVGDITGDLGVDVSDVLDSIDVSLDNMFED
jgi:hypothetical protein